MNLVNTKTGAILAEGTWKTVCDAVTETAEGMDENTFTVLYGGKWHLYTDIALEEEVLYRDYKNKFANCATKRNSYNQDKKTIVIYRRDY